MCRCTLPDSRRCTPPSTCCAADWPRSVGATGPNRGHFEADLHLRIRRRPASVPGPAGRGHRREPASPATNCSHFGLREYTREEITRRNASPTPASSTWSATPRAPAAHAAADIYGPRGLASGAHPGAAAPAPTRPLRAGHIAHRRAARRTRHRRQRLVLPRARRRPAVAAAQRPRRRATSCWDAARRAHPGYTVANICWWYAMGRAHRDHRHPAPRLLRGRPQGTRLLHPAARPCTTKLTATRRHAPASSTSGAPAPTSSPRRGSCDATRHITTPPPPPT